MSDRGGDGYVVVDSFECDGVTAGDSSADCVVLGTATAEIHVVVPEDRRTVSLRGPLLDVAVGKRVHALTSGQLVTYSRDGSRLWSVQIQTPRRLAALDDSVVVATDDGDLVGFDADAGVESFRTARPQSELDFDPILATGGDQLLVATWTFVAVVDKTGAVLATHNFDGTIDDVAATGDVVVASFTSDQIAGVDAKSGDPLWRRELAARSLSGGSAESVCVLTDDGLLSVAPDGVSEWQTSLSAEELFAASAGELFCTVSNGTVTTYREPGDAASAIDVEALSPKLPPGRHGGLPLSVANGASWPVETELHLSGDGLQIDPERLPVELGPGERLRLEPTVSATESDAAATVSVSCEGTDLLTERLQQQTGSPVDVEAIIEAVRDGIATVKGTVKNGGQRSLPDVTVSPKGATLDELHAEEERTIRTEVPYRPETTVSVTATDTNGGVLGESSATLPASPVAISTGTTDSRSIDVHLSNTTEMQITDRVLVDGDSLVDPVERSVELAPGEETSVRVRSLDPTDASASVQVILKGLELRQQSTVSGLRSTESADERATASQSNEAGSGERSESTTVRPSIETHVELSESTPAVSEATTEFLHLKNTGDEPLDALRYRTKHGTVSVGELPPDDETVLVREHALTEPTSATVAGGEVVLTTETVADVPERELTASSGDLVVEGSVERVGDSRYRATIAVRNQRAVACRLESIQFHTGDRWQLDPVEVIGPGEKIERSSDLRDAALASASAVETRLAFTFADSTQRDRFTTLLPVDGSGHRTVIEDLAVKLSYDTHVESGTGEVVVSLTNTADESMHDVLVEAYGPDVDTATYDSGSIDELTPGEQVAHAVSVATDDEMVAFTIEVRASTGAGRLGETIRVGGPSSVVNGWHRSLLEEWNLSRGESAGPERSAHVATAYRALDPDEDASQLREVDDGPDSVAKRESGRRTPRSSRDRSDGSSRPSTPGPRTTGSESSSTDAERRTASGDTASDRSEDDSRSTDRTQPTCDRCGETLPPGANYCPYCETKLSGSTTSPASPAESGAGSGSDGTDRTSRAETEECDYCGKSIPAGANFCPYCEAKLSDTDVADPSRSETESKYCKYCGSSVDRKARRCPSCDAELPL